MNNQFSGPNAWGDYLTALEQVTPVIEVRWRRKFGQLAKVGSTSMKDGLYDWEAEAVHG